MKLTIFAILMPLASWACNPDDEKVFKGNGNAETKPATTLLQGGEGLDGLGAKQDEEVKESASVTYNLKITSNSGAQLCNGAATLVIMSDFGLKFPEAKIQCLSLTIGLAGMLGAGSGLGKPGKDGDSNLTHDGKVLSVKNLGGAEFNPPRPFILGPVIQDASKYKGFKRDTDASVTAKDPQTGQQVSGNGTFHIEVFDEETTYENKYVGKAFDKVLHWQMTTTGFDNVPAKYGLVFEKWEWLWNVRPIMIPKIVIVGRLSDFISGDASTADAIVGRMTVELVVKEFDFK